MCSIIKVGRCGGACDCRLVEELFILKLLNRLAGTTECLLARNSILLELYQMNTMIRAPWILKTSRALNI